MQSAASYQWKTAETMAQSDDWEAWLDRHGGALLLLARQWSPLRSDAEDVLQEAFLRFWKSRESAVDPVAYLYSCVRTCAVDLRRGRVRQESRERTAARPEQTSEWFTALPQSRERDARIEQVLGQLPHVQREVVVMKIWGRLSFEQIAEALSVSPNTAASRYRYALEKLRAELAEERVP